MSPMKQAISEALAKALKSLGIADARIKLDYPENPDHGDFSTNAAMVHAKELKLPPKALAEKIVSEFRKAMPDAVESVDIAGPGFINFKVKDAVFSDEIISIVKGGAEYGWSQADKGRKVMVEYTDPNPFKVFHIGHLMSNAIGESFSRLVESSGADVIRTCYQGDVGLHVAKTIWAIQKRKDQRSKSKDEKGSSIVEKVKWLGEMYVYGSQYDDDKAVQEEIKAVNKKIFEKSDPEINAIYEEGRKVSLEYFDLIYKKLGTSFKQFYFESEVADEGIEIVKEFLKQGIFSASEGAIVFKGEDHGLHTRVFITSQGLPTYETKELGLNTRKFEMYPALSESIIVTANEQSDYFKVLLKAFELIDPNIAKKTRHISHGIMRFASGKMSSRKGNIISAEELLEDIKKLVMDKMSGRELDADEAAEIADIVAVGAIKYTILRQAVGGDIIFDTAASISFEGDSGPYLQYSAVRAASILEKAKQEGISAAKNDSALPEKASLLEKLITRFPDLIARARSEYAPQHIANYLISLAGAFNSYYASNQIVDKNDKQSPYRVALTQAFLTTMTNGLWVLGIKVPKKM